MQRRLVSLILCPLFLGGTANCRAETGTYTTWVPWQIDSVVSAWTLKRYVDPGAEFESVPRGTSLPPDRALDTPASPYRRNGRQTAFDEVLRIHGLHFACAGNLQPIVRILELASWRKSETPEAEKFEAELTQLMPRNPAKGGLEAAFGYIDQFCGAAAGKVKP